MRCIIAAMSLCLSAATAEAAKPPRYVNNEFSGDRWVKVQTAQAASDVTKSLKRPKVKYYKRVPKPKARPGYVDPLPKQTLTDPTAKWGGYSGSGLAGIAERYLGGNPTGWARRWCGVFMRLVVRNAGLPDHPHGNLARNWRSYGRPSGAHPGAIGVMPNHVGIVVDRCTTRRGGPGLLLRSGNHNRRVGDGCYAASRFIAFRSA